MVVFYNMNKFKDPENIDHLLYDCSFAFDEFGVYDCPCIQTAYRRGPVSFINNIMYETRKKMLHYK